MFVVPSNKLLLPPGGWREPNGQATAFYERAEASASRRRRRSGRTDPNLWRSPAHFSIQSTVYSSPLRRSNVVAFSTLVSGTFTLKEEVESEDRTLCYRGREREREPARKFLTTSIRPSFPPPSRLHATVGKEAPNLIIVAKIPHPDPYKSFHTSQLRQRPLGNTSTHTGALDNPLKTQTRRRRRYYSSTSPPPIDSSSDT